MKPRVLQLPAISCTVNQWGCTIRMLSERITRPAGSQRSRETPLPVFTFAEYTLCISSVLHGNTTTHPATGRMVFVKQSSVPCTQCIALRQLDHGTHSRRGLCHGRGLPCSACLLYRHTAAGNTAQGDQRNRRKPRVYFQHVQSPGKRLAVDQLIADDWRIFREDHTPDPLHLLSLQ